jgi:CubicO group peptidase (beta-lactamase class C family)
VDGHRQSHAQGATAQTVFRLCSVTKPYTATAVMALVQRGELDLDRPVRHYLPALVLANRHAQESVTARHLLLHTGGFEGELPGPLERFGDDDEALARAIGAFSVLRQWLPPGQAFGYANSGYWLAGAIIATVTGISFEAAVKALVLDPLGLERTFLCVEEALPRAEDVPAFPRFRIPSGGLLASIDDVLAFAAFHLGLDESSAPLSPTTRAVMREPVVETGTPGRWRGLGWRVERVGSADFVGHDGAHDDYRTALTLVPSRRVGIALLARGGNGRRWAEALRREWVHVLTGMEPPIPAPTVHQARSVLLSLAGLYAHPGDPAGTLAVTVAADGTTLRVTEELPDGDGASATYRSVGPGEFVVAEDTELDERLGFLLDRGGSPIALRLGSRLGGRRPNGASR